LLQYALNLGVQRWLRKLKENKIEYGYKSLKWLNKHYDQARGVVVVVVVIVIVVVVLVVVVVVVFVAALVVVVVVVVSDGVVVAAADVVNVVVGMDSNIFKICSTQLQVNHKQVCNRKHSQQQYSTISQSYCNRNQLRGSSTTSSRRAC
jgi:hypothetical protein